MKILLIAYLISIALFWLGFISMTITGIHYCKATNKKAKKDPTNNLFSSLLKSLIVSLIPILNLACGLFYLLQPQELIKNINFEEKSAP